jgi:hypothetical protein
MRPAENDDSIYGNDAIKCEGDPHVPRFSKEQE